MKMLLTATAAASLIAASAWAAQSDPHAGHHSAAPQAAAPAAGPSTAPSHAHSMQGMDEKSKHEMCKTVMGHDMANKSVHEHSRDKGGTVMWPNGKPLTNEEMAAVHKECVARMSADAGKTK